MIATGDSATLVERGRLLGLAVTALLLQLLLEQTRAPVRQRDYELKLDASRRADAAYAAIRAHREEFGNEAAAAAQEDADA